VVDKLDPNRLAFACGLQEGDVVRQVDGARVRTHKDIISHILTGLDNGGASVNILRDGQGIALIIQPVADNLFDESIFYDEEVDTLEPMMPMPEYFDDDSL
jgi:S1-C subfamily serine protease